jgi:hypothetical protein
MRNWYRTDASDGVGTGSSTIPDRVFKDGWQIVNVDWSVRGEVEVTFLVPGDGFVGSGDTTGEEQQ